MSGNIYKKNPTHQFLKMKDDVFKLLGFVRPTVQNPKRLNVLLN